jgi:hypothetical protein
MTPPVTADEFRVRFVRDFVYGVTHDKVTDADITNALVEATFVFNSALFDDTTEIKAAFLLAAAHFLVLNIQAAGGLSATNMGRGVNSRGGGVVQSKSVGGVSVNYAINPMINENAILSQFMRTDYGQAYLNILAPRLVGNCGVLEGSNDTGVGLAV